MAAKKSAAGTRVIIVGGGIGGLSVALCLHQVGFKPTVYERAPEISEMGVGINLLPHASKILHEVGLGAELDKIGIQTKEMRFYAHTSQLIYSEPRGRNGIDPYPQYSIHRGKLQLLLYQTVISRLGANSVKTDHEVVGFDQNDQGVTAHFVSFKDKSKRQSVQGDILIGVDGVKSTIRSILYPTEVPKFTGWVIWRGATLSDTFLDGKTMVAIGKGDTLMTIYPIDNNLASAGSKKSVINWGGLRKVPNGPTDENWQKVGKKEDFLPFVKDWKFDWINLEKLINDTEVVMEYSMHDRDPVNKWSFGRVTLCGDAAHPLLPFGSQGAGQAILDAAALRDALFAATKTGDFVQGLIEYEKSRISIAKAVVESNRQMGPTRILKVFEENPNVSKEEISKISKGYAVTAGVRAEKDSKL